ncbi:uncharacterized protein LOC129944849 [Eupeodes corollae]|uniref:uncharacterized protein LOC129944849 n=1 Tax=Eupeodes corollae TaxID=290404 RepID=UPI002490A1EE|nr:uncharacterized protein LOC129944849 [Eupeodes corollae]
MISLKVVTLFFVLSGSFGSEKYQLNSLIERIYSESNSAALLFIQMDNKLLSDFFSMNFEMQVSIFNSYANATTDYLKSFDFNKILVVQTPKKNYQFLTDKVIPKLSRRQFVIIASSNMDHLRESFVYFLEKKFTQIYGTVNDTSYGYLPFAAKRVQEFSEKTKLFDAYQNLNGYPVPITIEQDIPRVFNYPSKRLPYVRIGGFFGNIFKFFLITYNGTYNNIQIENCTDQCINSIDATLDNRVDISTNVYSMGSIPELDNSYPVRNTFKTVLVPIIDHLDTNQYFLRPFSYIAWICIGLTLVYLVLMDYIITSYLMKGADIWQSFKLIFLMMMGLPAGRQLTQNYRFYIQVILVAFILDNIYINYVTSFLTVFIKINQFDTKEDFYAHNVRIMLPFSEFNRTAYTGMYPENFEELFKPVSLEEYLTKRNAMNDTRNAYLTDSDVAEFLIELQSLFTKPLFRIIRRPLNGAQLCFVLPKHSPFKAVLNRYILNLQQTGLIQKWDRNVLYESLKAKFKGIANRRTYEPPLNTPLSLDHLEFAWNILIVGISLALLAFVGERYGKTWKNRLSFWKYSLGFKTKVSIHKNRML